MGIRKHLPTFIAATQPGSGAVGAPVSSIGFALPGSDLQPNDLFHGRRAMLGGSMARAWVAFDQAGTTYALTWQHAGSGADPTNWVTALSGATVITADLGAVARTPADVAAITQTALTTAGITGVNTGAADSEGRIPVSISGAENLQIPPTVDTTDTELRGMWGGQRDDWGGGLSGQALNSDGNTNVIGIHHVGNPGAVLGRAGRIIGAYVWGRDGFQPRLGVFSGPAYSLTPTALTLLDSAEMPAGLTGGEFGSVLFAEPVAFLSTDNLWVAYKESQTPDTTRGPRFRLHGQSPVGNGDLPAGQFLLVDQTTSPDETTEYPSSYTATVDSSFALYVMIGLIFELEDASGNYPADGRVYTRIGDQNDDDTHGTQFDVTAATLEGETTHHRFDMPQWYSAPVTEARRAVNAVQTAGADREDSRIAFYQWDDITIPSTGTHDLISDAGFVGFDTENAYNSTTFGTPVDLGTDALGANAIVSIGFNYVTEDGSTLDTYNLPVFLDGATGDGSWLNCWEDDRENWHDDIPGASDRGYTSGVSEYRTRESVRTTSTMPATDTSETWPDPFDVDPSDDSPNALALDTYTIDRGGIVSS